MAFQDFDLISKRREEERRQKARKRITIAVVSTVAILLVAGAAVGVFLYQNNQQLSKEQNSKAPSSPPKAVNAAEKAVKTVCGGTDYVKTCEKSLLKEVKSTSDTLPEDILRSSFAVASGEIDKAIKQASSLKVDGPLKKAALEDCLVLLHDAKEELESSISSVKGKDISKLSSVKPDINNWLSAVLSFQQTCIDGFPDGEEKTAMKKLLKTAKEHSSNALAIVSRASSLLPKLKASNAQRKLLVLGAAGLPTWMDQDSRRMLKADRTKFTPNVTVARDGSGNFTTITAALNAMPEKYKGRYVIYVKRGVYEESVNITKKMVNITIYGEGSQKSIITGSKSYDDGVTTFRTATFAVLGEGFLAQSIGFRNTAGPEKHQAVALRVQADRSIFVNCRMEGYQSVLYAQTHRHFYRSCYITGTVDFIFGDAAAVFQNCMIYVRKGAENQQNTVTAQGRVDKRQTTGFVLQNCRILADKTLEPEKEKVKSYLGRPWREYSRTLVMETEIGDLIQPEGWVEWSGDFGLKTLYFAEYNNKGAGSGTSGRVKWPGYKSIEKEEAKKYTVGPFLQGESWVKDADVPVRFGMFS